MRPITEDEKQLVLRRLMRDLARLRTDAGNLDLDMLAFLLMPIDPWTVFGGI